MAEARKLYRSRKNRMIGGVCGGLGEYFNIDPIIFRALFVLFTLADGAGILVYIVMMFIVPDENKVEGLGKVGSVGGVVDEIKEGAQNMARDFKENPRWMDNRRNWIGLIVVAIGLLILIQQIVPMHWFRWDFVWPILIVIVGLFLILKRK
ncbi:MAG: PspC domain-containing protein [Patescibacteria group bacterium]|jgi:phage shock protein PspC (stress-responsive transcriptional regulator)